MEALTYFLLFVFTILQYLDVDSTNKALKAGGMEANPIVRWLMSKLGDKWWVIKIPVLAITFYAFSPPTNMVGVSLLTAINLLYVWVVANNYKIGDK